MKIFFLVVLGVAVTLSPLYAQTPAPEEASTETESLDDEFAEEDFYTEDTQDEGTVDVKDRLEMLRKREQAVIEQVEEEMRIKNEAKMAEIRPAIVKKPMPWEKPAAATQESGASTAPSVAPALSPAPNSAAPKTKAPAFKPVNKYNKAQKDWRFKNTTDLKARSDY